MIKAKISNCPNKRMTGPELRYLMAEAKTNPRQLAKAIGTYRRKVQRWADAAWFELTPQEMVELLKILGASSL